jgi:minor fimbrial subunit
MRLPLFPALLLLSFGAQAYTCGALGRPGGTSNANVVVNSNIETGKNQIVDLGAQISCKNEADDSSWVDTMWLASNGVWLNTAVFPGLKGGVTVSGKDYLAPVPEMKVFELRQGESKNIPVVLYFELASMGQTLHIRSGDELGRINFVQTNNHGERVEYTWRFYAANNIDIYTSTCKIQSGTTLDVDLGQVERSDIVSGNTSVQTVKKDLNITCDGTGTVEFEVKMSAMPASWNNNAISTSNSDVGIEMRWNGNVMANGDSQKFSVVNGSTTVPLSFTPVKSSTVDFDKISTGVFSASATMIITQQ